VSGSGTNLIVPAIPIAISHNRLFLGLFGLAVNSEFHHPKYISMLPAGPDPKHAFSAPFFGVAMGGDPKPKTLALLAEDAEFPKNASERARDIANQNGITIVYDKTYPPGTPDFTSIVHAIQGANPDMVFFGMVGLQYTSVKQQFGPKLNGVVNYDFWIPAPTMQFPGILGFLKKYQAQAVEAGVDPLGWYLPPFAYANLRVLGDTLAATNGLDQSALADNIRSQPFKTIVGDISFGKDGEWSKPRVLEVQWQNIKGNGVDQFRDTNTEVILEPPEYRTGTVIARYNGGAGE
jgi:branched-chain amino acid transport system substrate-binding protein